MAVTYSLTQTTLDGSISTLPRIPQFTVAGLLDHIVEFVVCEDEVSHEPSINALLEKIAIDFHTGLPIG